MRNAYPNKFVIEGLIKRFALRNLGIQIKTQYKLTDAHSESTISNRGKM